MQDNQKPAAPASERDPNEQRILPVSRHPVSVIAAMFEWLLDEIATSDCSVRMSPDGFAVDEHHVRANALRGAFRHLAGLAMETEP